jgi:ABC-type dipeptide/oligopeptide/nickel transport system ATPase component
VIAAETPLLEAYGLTKLYGPRVGCIDVALEVHEGEVLGVVGESGAGKSVTGAAVIGLIDPPGRIASGEIRLSGRRIDNLPSSFLDQFFVFYLCLDFSLHFQALHAGVFCLILFRKINFTVDKLYKKPKEQMQNANGVYRGEGTILLIWPVVYEIT